MKVNRELFNVVSLLVGCLIWLAGCSAPVETYAERIENCLANATLIEFDVEGSDRKGFSHDVEPECLIGVTLPEFEGTDLAGNPIGPGNIRGKVNVINFWFTTCKPCIAEIPSLNALAKKYDGGGVNFLAIARDSADRVNTFLDEHPFDFTIIPNGKDLIADGFQLMWGYPFTMITDRNNTLVGTIRAGQHSPELAVKEIESVLVRYLGQ